MLIKQIIAVNSLNHKKLINTFCEQIADLLNVKTGGTCKLKLCFNRYIECITMM